MYIPILIQRYDSLKLRDRIDAIVTLHQYATMEDAERAARKAIKWIRRNQGVKNARPPAGIQNCIVLLARVQKARAQYKQRILKENKEADRLRNNPPPHDDVKELEENGQNEPDRADKQDTG